MSTECVLCGRRFFTEGVMQLAADERFCVECAMTACEKLLTERLEKTKRPIAGVSVADSFESAIYGGGHA